MTTSTSPTGSSRPTIAPPPSRLRASGGGGAPGWRWAVTDAAAGNLADHVGDDPGAVAARRAAVLGALPGATALVLARQVHGAGVHEVVAPDLRRPAGDDRDGGDDGAGGPAGTAVLTLGTEADALVTTLPGVALGVVVADCVPVVVCDAAGAVVGVAHAGRRGADAGVVPALVEAVRALGGRRPTAVVGPSVCGRCYEVPAAMRAEVCARHPSMAATTRGGTPALDVAAGVLAQLAGAGVPAEHLPGCTVEDDALFSVRRDGAGTGRCAALVWRTLPQADLAGGAR